MAEIKPEIRSLGPGTLIFAFPPPHTLEKQRAIWEVRAAFSACSDVVECVAGMNNLTVRFDPLTADAGRFYERFASALHDLKRPTDEFCVSHTIRVRYGGDGAPDLYDVCERTGLSEREVIERHQAAEYRVYFVGFAPGFAYLGDLDPRLIVPRRRTPRTVVPAGSVAIGGAHTGIYPFALPGGWNIIGRTEQILFDPNRDPPALLAPGDRVRFIEDR